MLNGMDENVCSYSINMELLACCFKISVAPKLEASCILPVTHTKHKIELKLKDERMSINGVNQTGRRMSKLLF